MNITNTLSSVLLISIIPIALLHTKNVTPRKRDVALAVVKKIAYAGPELYLNYKTGQAASKELPGLKSQIDLLKSDVATKTTEVAIYQERDKNTNIRIENAVLHATVEAQKEHAELKRELVAAQNKADEDASKLDKVVKIAVFTGVVSTIYVAKSVYDWARPATPDEKAWREYAKGQATARDQAARNALDFMKTEKEFRKCIFDHAKKAKRADGIPMECSTSADKYIKYLGTEEWSKIKTDYNEHVRE